MAGVDEVPAEERTTAPQSPYTMRQVGTGFAVFAVGLALILILAFLV